MTAHAPDWLHRADLTLHSGVRSAWKIECDALTDEEMATFAMLIAERVGPICSVRGVPRGGVRIAEAVGRVVSWSSMNGLALIVDDVLTSSQSMERERINWTDEGVPFAQIRGAVLFARGPCPAWVTPVFTLSAPR
jgi:hypothetical protein